jgi:hypothetical protein
VRRGTITKEKIVLLIETHNEKGEPVILTVARNVDASIKLRLYTPKPSIGPFADDLIATIELSAQDAHDLRKHL